MLRAEGCLVDAFQIQRPVLYVEGGEVLRAMIETSLSKVGPSVFWAHGESSEVAVTIPFGMRNAEHCHQS